MDKEKQFRKKKITVDDMKAIWFPSDWQEVIMKRAEEEGLPAYKYVMMLSNNHKIHGKSSNKL